MSSAWITVHSQCLVQRINIGHCSKGNNNASKILLTLGEFTFVTLFFFFFFFRKLTYLDFYFLYSLLPNKQGTDFPCSKL